MIHSIDDLLKLGALGGAALSILIIVWYLAKRPPLGRLAKVLLFLGLGVFPLGVAAVQVGDSVRDDVNGARGAGMGAVLLDRKGRHPHVEGAARINTLDELQALLGLEG